VATAGSTAGGIIRGHPHSHPPTHRAREPVARKPMARWMAVACRVRASAILNSGSNSATAALCTTTAGATGQHEQGKDVSAGRVTGQLGRSCQRVCRQAGRASTAPGQPVAAAVATCRLLTCAGLTRPVMPVYATTGLEPELELPLLLKRRHATAAAAASAATPMATGASTLQSAANDTLGARQGAIGIGALGSTATSRAVCAGKRGGGAAAAAVAAAALPDWRLRRWSRWGTRRGLASCCSNQHCCALPARSRRVVDGPTWAPHACAAAHCCHRRHRLAFTYRLQAHRSPLHAATDLLP
jgi:hypothetical protein